MNYPHQYRYDETLKNHFLDQVLDAPKFKAFYLKAPGLGRMESCLIMFSPEGINVLGDLCPGNDSRNSGVHAYGYGLDWFAGNLSSSYLCEKFLSKEWHKELAIDDCRRIAEQILIGETAYFDRDKQLEQSVGERIQLAQELRDILSDRRNNLTSEMDVKIAIFEIRHRGAALKTQVRARRQEQAQKYVDLADELDGGDMGVESFGKAMYEIDGDFWEHSPGYGYHPRCKNLLVAIQKKFSELYHKMKQSCPVGEA